MQLGAWLRGLAVTVAVVGVFATYSWRLHDSPVYLTADEIVIGLQGHSLASTGHDLRGRSLPLYFQIDEFRMKGTIWYQPLIMYSTAIVLKFAHLTEWAIRLPAVIVGVIDVILIFFAARAIYGRVAIGAAAALMLFLSPAHFIFSRFAMDYIFPVPFLLGWLVALAHYHRTREPRLLFAATLCLGLGFYSYIAAIGLMSIYFAFTLWLVWRSGAPGRHFGFAITGFALPLLAFAGWLLTHQNVVSETIARYDLANPGRLGPIGRLDLYWHFLSPSFLFFNGGSEQMFTTRTTGVFLLPLLLLIPYGIYRALRSGSPIDHVLLLGFLSAPLAAILLDEPFAINRAIEILPFGVLLASGAIHHALPAIGLALVPRRAWLIAVVAAALVVVGIVQWRGFLVDYYGDYRVRSAPLFQGNVERAIVAIMSREPAAGHSTVYVARDLTLWWRFYALKHQRNDLLKRVSFVASADLDSVPRGAFVLLNVQTAQGRGDALVLAESGATIIDDAHDLDGAYSFAVLQR